MDNSSESYDSTSNSTLNRSTHGLCNSNLYLGIVTVTDMLNILIGQPVIARLLWVLLKSKKPTDILNLNLALFHNLQYILSVVHLFSLWHKLWYHTIIVACIFNYVQSGAPTILSFICLERYVAVIHPTWYPCLKTYRCREAAALSVWLVVLPCTSMQVYYRQLSSQTLRGVNDNLPYCIMSLTLFVIIWCNTCIFRALRMSGPATDKLHPVKKRALQIVRTISVLVGLCYLPVNLLSMYQKVTGQMSDCVLVPLGIFFISVASVVHPMFYLSTLGKGFGCHKQAK